MSVVLELQPGDVFQGYRVLRSIGRGGMGAVYLVHHPRFDAQMALKVMALQAATEEELAMHRARFAREAKILVRLRHQAIIRVHDFAEHVDEDGVSPYILMEYFAGTDGMRWLKSNPSLDQVHHVAKQLADALAVAHEEGVLHRDIKYGNILVNDRNEAVLIDFGIAKGDNDETVTQTNYSVGTLSHMAPEYLSASLKGEHPEHTAQTDLWAFGCLLYFLTCHRNAFQSGGRGQGALIKEILEEPHQPVRSIRAEASVEWSSLIDALLEKNPKERIFSARELLRRLEAITSVVDPTAPPFDPPLPVGAVRSSVSGPSSSSSSAPASSSAAPSTSAPSSPPPATVQARMRALPPLDGVTGVGTAQGDPLSLSGFSVVEPPAAQEPQPPRPLPSPPSTTPPSSPSLDAASIVAPPPAPAVVPPPEPASTGLGTFIASIQPEAHVAPVAVQTQREPPVAAPLPPDDDATPSTGDRSLVQFPLPDDESVVRSLPSFTPPAPQAEKKTTALRSLLLPVAAVALTVVVGGVALSLLGHTPTPAAAVGVTASSAQDDTLRKAEERAKRELEAVEKARAKAPPVVAAAAVPMPQASSPAPSPGPAETPSPRPRSTRRQRPAAASKAPAEPVEAVDPITARYGNRNFNTSAFGGSASPAEGAPGAAATSAPKSASTAGVKIPVRVTGELVSAPGPVIAVVTKATRLGERTLPAGTQIHGTTSRGTGNRVAVRFTFAVVDGQHVPLQGIALAQDGRAGLPGTRTLGNGSDVAARALGDALGASVDVAAEVVGDNPLGAAFRGGGNTAARKTDRIANDEDMIVVKRNTRFFVYVER